MLVRLVSTSFVLFLLACSTPSASDASVPGDAGVDALPPIDPPPAGNVGSPLGSNFEYVSYYNGYVPFVDVMKQARAFFSGVHFGTWDDGRALDVDADGWVRSLASDQVARAVLLGSDGGEWVPTGIYTVLYDGNGTLEYGGATVVSREPGRELIEVVRNELHVSIVSTDQEDYLRNLRVLAPGGSCRGDIFRYCESDSPCDAGDGCARFEETYASQPFHPVFLEEHRAFSTLRFMNWMRTNRDVAVADSEEPPLVVEWDEYPRRSSVTWRTVPLDVIAQLGNTLSADVWVNVPHTASDAFVTAMATSLRTNLRPDRKIYVELSNEVWNGIFDQFHYANRAGCLLWSADASSECRRPGDTEVCQPGAWDTYAEACYYYGIDWYAKRTAEVMLRFEEVFGAEASTRLVRVLAGQTGSASSRARRQLDFLYDGTTPVSRRVDAFAVAPYFGGGMSPATVDEVFATAMTETWGFPAGTYLVLSGTASDPYGGPLVWLRDDVRSLGGRADLSHIRVIAYEGGQHFVSQDPDVLDRMLAINRDPRMGDVYRQYLERFMEITGGGMFVHYKGPSIWSQWGLFGSKEYQGQPRASAPKYDALLRFIEAAQAGG